MKIIATVIPIFLAGCVALDAPSVATAAEGGAGAYLLGINGNMGVGILPQPGAYLTNIIYYYNAGAPEVVLSGKLELNASINVVGDIVQFLDVTKLRFLGSNYAFAIGIPLVFGANLTAEAESIGAPFPEPIKRSSSVATGDLTLIPLMLGWKSGNFYFKTTGVVFAPTGQYNVNQKVNIGGNHWAFDPEFAVTWLDPKTGLEATASLGYTFNFVNPSTNYLTGNEFHIEYVLAEHFTSGWAVGLGGYFYDQVTEDSGTGAVLGPFEGQAWALGPQIAYFGKINGGPFTVSGRWYHEFNAVNRFEGDSFFLTGTFRL